LGALKLANILNIIGKSWRLKALEQAYNRAACIY